MEKDNNNEVKIVEVCKISPYSQNLSKLSLPLSAFDWMFMKLPPIKRVFFYPIINGDDHSHYSFFNSVLIPNLKHSLSLTLQHFLPLAGNLVWPDDSPLPFILYTPTDAVSFTVAETDSDFDDHVSDNHIAREIKNKPSHPFVPNLIQETSVSAVPMMAIQITKFPNNRGFSIGFATHRVLFDGKSFNIFLKSWAHICKLPGINSLPIELTPSFERPTNVVQNPFDYFFVDPKNRTLKFPSSRSTHPSNLFRGRFQLSQVQIQKLEKRVLEWVEKTSSQQFYLSKFVVVYAYVLICLIKAKQAGGGKLGGKIQMSFHADARWLLDPPVSSNYIGNCVSYPSVVVEVSEFMEEDEEEACADGHGHGHGRRLTKIAKKISEMIVDLRMRRNGAVMENVRKSVQQQQKNNKHYLRSGGEGEVEVYFNVDSPKSKFYETDFGWGKPKKIDVVLEECNSFSLLDTRDGDAGVEVGLLLPTHQLHIFASLFFNSLN